MTELVIHPQSKVGRARANTAAVTEEAQASAEALRVLEEEAAHAQQRLQQLEAEPVSLKHPDVKRELEISALRRGLQQQQTKIDAAKVVADEDERRLQVSTNALLVVERRLSEVHRKLDLLSDLSNPHTEMMTIRDHRQWLADMNRELESLTGAPSSTAVAAAA